MKLGVTLDILNQKDTPAFFADILANRPAAGFTGRIFVDTNVPSTGLYRDTGSSWIQIADQGAGTTGTLQQVTTNGNTTNQGISITAGALTLGTASGDNQTLLNLPANTSLLYREGAGSLYGFNIGAGDNSLFLNNIEGGYYQTLYFGDGINTNIFGISASDDAGVTYNSVFVVNQNKLVGINTNAPTATFDVHGDVSVIQQLNQTTATNNTLLAFQNSNAGLWRIGNFYNAGANDFGVFDVVGAIQPITIKKTTGQVLIGTSNVGSGKLVVSSSTSDNGIQIVGANAPSLRIDNSESGPTKRIGLGISTAANNFIQGSADRDMCIFNGTTTASPILFGIYDTTNVQEAARISASRNLIIGGTSDSGQKLQVFGAGLFYGTSGSPVTLTIASGNSNCDITLQSSNTSSVSRIRNATNDLQFHTNGTLGLTIASNQAAIFSKTGVFGKANATPFKVLDVIADIADGYNDPVNFESYGTAGANVILRFAKGTYAAPTAVTAGDLLGSIGARGYDGTNFSGGGRVGMYMYAAENFTPTNQGSFLLFGTTSIGTAARVERMRLVDNGNLLLNTSVDSGQKLQVSGTTLSTSFASTISTISVPSVTPTTFYTATARGLYIAHIYLAGNQTQTWDASIIFNFNATNILIANQINGTNVSISVSGADILVTQIGGSTFTFNYEVIRIA